MQDRVSEHPGRIKLTPVPGQENTFDMVRADEPVQEGTPLNKSTLMTDETAAAIGLTSKDPTVNDAIRTINASLVREMNDGFKVGDIRLSRRMSLGENYRIANGEAFEPESFPSLADLLPRTARLELLSSETLEDYGVNTSLGDVSLVSGGGYYVLSYRRSIGNSKDGYTSDHYIAYSTNIEGPYTSKKIASTANASNISKESYQNHHSVYVNGKFYVHVPWIGIILSASDPAGEWTTTYIKNESGSTLKVYSFSMFTHIDGMFVIAIGHKQYYATDISNQWREHTVTSASYNEATFLINAGGWYYQFFQESGHYKTLAYRSQALLGTYNEVKSYGSELPRDVSTDGKKIYLLTYTYNDDKYSYLRVIDPDANTDEAHSYSGVPRVSLSAGLENQSGRTIMFAGYSGTRVYACSETDTSSYADATNGRAIILVDNGKAYIFVLNVESNTDPATLRIFRADMTRLPSVSVDNTYAYVKVKEDEP